VQKSPVHHTITAVDNYYDHHIHHHHHHQTGGKSYSTVHAFAAGNPSLYFSLYFLTISLTLFSPFFSLLSFSPFIIYLLPSLLDPLSPFLFLFASSIHPMFSGNSLN
jgi:hypothetical protein